MNNIIHVIVEKVKREIEESVIKVLEGNANLDDIVDSVREMVNDIEVKITALFRDNFSEVVSHMFDFSRSY